MEEARPSGRDRIGPIAPRLIRDVRLALLVLVLLTVAWAALLRPDYLDPTQLGTDVGFYRGAGERLLVGGKPNALAPGDRPEPIWPPAWTGPLVSPPTMGVVWMLGAIPPAAPAIVVWWLGALALTVGVVTLIILFGPLAAGVAIGPLALAIAITSWTGNVNGYLLALSAITWSFGLAPGWRRPAVAGALVALGAGVKVGPLLLLAWLIGQRRWAAVASALVTGLALLAVTLLVAGSSAFTDYLGVAQDASANPQPGPAVSVLLKGIGVDPAIAQFGPYGFGALCGVASIALFRKPRVAFAIAVVGSVFALPVVRYESLTLLLGAFLPWTLDRAAASLARDRRPWLAAAAAGAAALAVVGAIGLANTRTSRLVMSNASAGPVFVRVYFNGIPESFGYAVPAGATLRGWGPLTGSVSGPVLVFDGSCRELSRSDIPPAGGWLQVAADGSHLVVDGAPAGPAPFAAYDPTCAERAP